ncbi:MAG: hypothetical protein OXI69_00135 [Acidobacteriota bacterium]|nr:hypothetical protein [Acidobacteriota bacterium]
MNQELALRVLGKIMDWSDEQAREEFRWLRLMARLKYDSYRDFQAGMRFIESLVMWLQQFTPDERNTAYDFVRTALVYFGQGEVQRLVEQFYPHFVHDRLVRSVAAKLSIPTYRVLADSDARAEIGRLRRQTLFLGLSDGARMDTIRHANTGRLSNEQLVGGIQLDTEKWKDLLNHLRSDLADEAAKFRIIYLIDDFTASGSTFLRADQETGWKGKLVRFKHSINDVAREGSFLSPDWELCIHHYMASANAAISIESKLSAASDFLNDRGWAHAIHASFGTILPDDLPVDSQAGRYKDFVALARKYYDPEIETKHTKVGTVSNMALGYAGGALPVVLEHNTPNNSVALLWAETGGGERGGVAVPAMRPLFRRRQRHL